MNSTLSCHECGSRMVRDVRPDTVTYKRRSMTVQQPGWYCNDCGEVVYESADAAVAESAFVRLKSEVDDILSPDEVQRIRKKLRLSQRRAGSLLGGGPRSFQKYESGTDWVSKAMANLLRLLDHEPGLIEHLVSRTQAGGRRVAAGRQRSARNARSTASQG